MKSVSYLLMAAMVVFLSAQLVQGQTSMSKEALIEKGEYLIMIAGCHDCHTPKKMTPEGPVPNMQLKLSGHPQDADLPDFDPSDVGPGKWVLLNESLTAFVGPWGMTFSPNLTPDKQTGIGLWTEQNFIKAMRTGKHMGTGRPILPPMPWTNLKNAKTEDLKAMFAYLKSIKPIKNLVPGPVPAEKLAEINQ
ncbi:MAG: diheme cytochrome c-553 [Caldithrix sp.]|nr:diheme cytochrome c-553 [Caldithrix sp.]